MEVLKRVSFGRDEQFLTGAAVGGALGAMVAGGFAWLTAGRLTFSGATAGAAVGVLLGAVRLPLVFRLVGAGAAMVLSIVSARALSAAEVAVGVLAVAFACEAQRWRARVTTFFGVCLGGVWAWGVTRALSMPHLHAPWLALVAPMFGGVFLGLGAWLGSLRLAPDAVAPRLEAIAGAADAWTRVRKARARFPPSAPLTTLLSEGAERLITAGRALEEVRVDEKLEEVTRDAVKALTDRLAVTDDEELKHHLTQTLRVHRDVLEQLDTLKRQKERAAAQVRAHLSWLETVAFSLETAPAGPQALNDVTERLAKLRPV